MTKRIVLDTGVLSNITHPRKHPDIKSWFKKLVMQDVIVYIPEIADYELRRELIRAGKEKSIQRLDLLEATLGYLPINTPSIRKAAELWAQARNEGYPTAEEPALDGDVILAAQALILQDQTGVTVVATDNVGHLSRFITAKSWREIESQMDK